MEYGVDRKGAYLPEKTRDGKPMFPGNLPEHMPGPENTYQSYGYGWANASNTPYRLFKQHDHEGGTRSPLIMSWPKAKKRGIASQVSHAIDLMPTLLDAAEAPVPKTKFDLEGRSMFADEARETLFWAHAKGSAIRKGDWKLVRENKKPWELYNLAEDGTELNDLASKMPEKVAGLESELNEWAKRTNLSRRKKKE